MRGGDNLDLPVVRLSLIWGIRLDAADVLDVLCRNPKSICGASGTRRVSLAPGVMNPFPTRID